MARISPLTVLGVALVGGLWLAERARPLRRQTHSTASRQARNLALGAGTMLVVTAIFMPLILAYTAWAYYVFRGKVGHEGYH